MSTEPTYIVKPPYEGKKVCPSCNQPRSSDNFMGAICRWCDAEEQEIKRNPARKSSIKLNKQRKTCLSCTRELVNSSRNYATPESKYCRLCDSHEKACNISDKLTPAVDTRQTI